MTFLGWWKAPLLAVAFKILAFKVFAYFVLLKVIRLATSMCLDQSNVTSLLHSTQSTQM
jgi:hypothetical protein